MSDRLPQRILSEIATWHEPKVVSANCLLHLADRAAVSRALSRLSHRGELLRIGHGLYVRPICTRFGVRSPEVAAVLGALQADSGEVIAPGGSATANQLGLTTQVPVCSLYLTSGRTRRLRLGAQTVELRHAPRWQLVLAERPAGAIIRALAWAGRERSVAVAARLRNTLSPGTIGELSNLRDRLPAWIAEVLRTMAARR